MPGSGPCSVSGGRVRSVAADFVAMIKQSRANLIGSAFTRFDDLRTRPKIVPGATVPTKKRDVKVEDPNDHEDGVGQGEERGLPG